MKKCNKCNITIETKQPYCPLCHQVLNGESDEKLSEVYPEHIVVRRMILPTTKKILLFTTLLSVLILALINYVNFDGRFWSLIPIGSIVYFWILVRVGVLSRRNIAFRIAFLTVLLIGLLIMIDYNSFPENNGWSVNYLMPILLTTCNLAISVIIWIKRIYYRDYFFYLLIVVIFSLIPLILGIAQVISVFWPSIVAFGLAMFILLFLLVFFPRSIREEIKKRFHA